MKKFLLIAMIIGTVASCKNKVNLFDQKYIYTEITKDGNKEIEFKEKTASMAYNEAFRKFCIGLAAESMTRKSYADYSALLGFKLFDSNGKIVNRPLDKLQEDTEKQIEENVFGQMKVDSIAKIKLYNFKISELQLSQ